MFRQRGDAVGNQELNWKIKCFDNIYLENKKNENHLKNLKTRIKIIKLKEKSFLMIQTAKKLKIT